MDPYQITRHTTGLRHRTSTLHSTPNTSEQPLPESFQQQQIAHSSTIHSSTTQQQIAWVPVTTTPQLITNDAQDIRLPSSSSLSLTESDQTQETSSSSGSKRKRTANRFGFKGEPANAFSKDVCTLIRQAIENKSPEVDLTHHRVRTQQLRSYLSLLPSIDPEAVTTRALFFSDTEVQHPKLKLSKEQIAKELLSEEPHCREGSAQSLTELLSYPDSMGAVSLVESDGTMASTQNQIQWLNQFTESSGQFKGLWQILDAYRKDYHHNQYKGDFFDYSLKPFINLHKHYQMDERYLNKLASLDTFFGKLSATREYQSDDTRPLISNRAFGILQRILTSPQLFDEITNDAAENLSNCQDRRAVVLLDMELRCIQHQLIANAPSESELFDQGLKFLRLSTAESMVWKELVHLERPNPLHRMTGSEYDRNELESVEMILYFRTHLNDLGLPTNCTTMQHAEGQFSMPTDFLDKVRDQVKKITQDHTTVQEFFSQWEPWRKHLKEKHPQAFEAHQTKAHEDLEALMSNHSHSSSIYWSNLDTNNQANEILQRLKEEEDETIASLSNHIIGNLFAQKQRQQPQQPPLWR